MVSSGDFRTGRSVVYHLTAHIVLTPKYRRKVFTPEVSESVESAIKQVCEKNKVTLVSIGFDGDHVHLIIDYPPTITLSNFIGKLKGYSSLVVRRDCASELSGKLSGDHFWSPSYFVSSTGGVVLDKVRKYVEDQGKKPRPVGNPSWVTGHSSRP